MAAQGRRVSERGRYLRAQSLGRGRLIQFYLIQIYLRYISYTVPLYYTSRLPVLPKITFRDTLTPWHRAPGCSVAAALAGGREAQLVWTAQEPARR